MAPATDPPIGVDSALAGIFYYSLSSASSDGVRDSSFLPTIKPVSSHLVPSQRRVSETDCTMWTYSMMSRGKSSAYGSTSQMMNEGVGIMELDGMLVGEGTAFIFPSEDKRKSSFSLS